MTVKTTRKIKSRNKDSTSLRGFYRVHIVDADGTVAGDSGWQENQITNLGFNKYLVSALGAIAGSLQISHLNVGTGGAPAAADTALAGEVVGTNSVVQRASVTAATSSTSKTVRFTATLSSANSFVTATNNVSNVGLFNSSASGTLFAGNTYASSSCATNQNVNCTYDIVFS